MLKDVALLSSTTISWATDTTTGTSSAGQHAPSGGPAYPGDLVKRLAVPCELPILPTYVSLRSGPMADSGGPERSAHWMVGSGGSSEPASTRS